MNFRKAVAYAVFSAVLVAALVGALAYADEFDQAMKLTFSQPVAIPGQVLPAGTYWLMRPAHGTTPNALEVWDADRKHVLATIETGNVQIAKPSGHIILSFADRSPNQPDALLSIVYPGTTQGHLFEIVYPGQMRSQFSELPKITMKVGSKGEVEREETNER